MSENYKGYLIAATAWQNPGEKWRPKVTIIDPNGEQRRREPTHARATVLQRAGGGDRGRSMGQAADRRLVG